MQAGRVGIEAAQGETLFGAMLQQIACRGARRQGK